MCVRASAQRHTEQRFGGQVCRAKVEDSGPDVGVVIGLRGIGFRV